jgi:potassium efflux system protein
MTVGLGFGLQEIFANFVSGLIILFERPIRIGDIVTVGEVTGYVTQIRMRATTITDWDARELVVPNKEFITGNLINWTLSNPTTRIHIPVGVAYGSDTVRAREIMQSLAERSEYVLTDPAPFTAFCAFGDNALELRLYVYLARRELYWDAFNELATGIDLAFREAGISIAFPQRDIHFSADRPLRVQIEHPGQPDTWLTPPVGPDPQPPAEP